MKNDSLVKKKLVVIIPAYNESERIDSTINALKKEIIKLSDAMDVFLYVIDDGSSDDTYKNAFLSGADRILRNKINKGLGAAVRTGLAGARADGADIVVKFDADLQHDPSDIPALIQPILDDEADVVYGNRFERISYKMPLLRRAGNLVFTGLMKWLTGWPLKDSQPGIFSISRAYLDVFQLPGDYNYTQQILLDAYHKGMRFAHCTVSFRKRVTGNSFVSLKYPFKVLLQIFMVVVGVKPMKIFAPIGLVSLLMGSLIFTVEMGYWAWGGAAKPVMHVNAVLGSIIFGMQTLFFGIIAQLIINTSRYEK